MVAGGRDAAESASSIANLHIGLQLVSCPALVLLISVLVFFHSIQLVFALVLCVLAF